jgi:hypothetical protein
MCWDALPCELQELILANLSLTELTRVSRTCRAIQAAFGRQMAREQKARCDLAVECFGHERIACIASLADRFLKGERVHPALDEGVIRFCSICADGTLRVNPNVGQRLTCEPADLPTEFWFWLGSPPSMSIVIKPTLAGRVSLCCNRGKKNFITVYLRRDQDVKGLALVHALLDGCLAPTFQSHGLPIHVHIRRYTDYKSVYTPQGLQAQIAPLLPFVSRYTFERKDLTGKAPTVFKEQARPWIRGLGANKEITLSVLVELMMGNG